MMIDPPPGFRDELTAAVAVLNPQIDGLEDLRLASISAEAKALVEGSLALKRQRRQLILALINGMDVVNTLWDSLKGDGYPLTPAVIAEAALVAELKAETDAILTALKIFSSPLPAGKLQISLGNATRKVS